VRRSTASSERERSGILAPVVLAYDLETPLGLGPDAHREALERALTGLAPDPSFMRAPHLGRIARLDAIDARSDDERDASRASRIIRGLARRLAPAVRALSCEPARLGVVIGTSTGGLDRTEAFLAGSVDRDSYSRDAQHAIAALADDVARVLGARGPRVAVSTACTSGAKAFAIARRWLLLDRVDAVLVGAADGLCGTTVRGFESLGVLAAERARPFSGDATGMNVGEGGALFLIARDGIGPARLIGYGESTDAFHLASPEPEGRGAEASIRAALHEAGRQSVDHVNAHGTGTAHNDRAEASALARTVGPRPWVSSTKGATGHLLGAAGAVEAAFAILAIEHGLVPATLGAEPARYAEIRVAKEVQRTPIETVLSTSLAFGGNNTALVFGRSATS